MIKNHIKHILFKMKWRKMNPSNYTFAVNDFNPYVVSVGNKTYGGLTVYTFNNINRLTIGSFCSIGPGTTFVLSADHHMNMISTYPFKAKIIREKKEGTSKGNIVIDDDVWIGTNATILSGIHIGKGAVIAAGAVVSHNVPPYAIVGGVPAKILRYRFDEEVVDYLMKIDYDEFTDDFIRENIGLLYVPITKLNYKEIIDKLSHK